VTTYNTTGDNYPKIIPFWEVYFLAVISANEFAYFAGNTEKYTFYSNVLCFVIVCYTLIRHLQNSRIILFESFDICSF
jgi:hypothetical protein